MFPINHDLHCHSGLSSCSNEPDFSADDILRHAVACGYDMVAITNHMFDSLLGTHPFYGYQNEIHLRKALPLPKAEGIRFLYGCETEMIGYGRIALHPSHYDEYEIILIPVNHFDLNGFTRNTDCSVGADWFRDQLLRLESITDLDLPWKRIGLAHLRWFEAEADEIPAMLALESRYEEVFQTFARLGAGIELNAAAFIYTDPSKRNLYDTLSPEAKKSKCVSYDKMLWLFSLAKKAGCKFYLGSDAHDHRRLDWPGLYLPRICTDLGLTDNDRFMPM